MKNTSGYVGSPEKWIDFISAWSGFAAEKKSKPSVNYDLYKNLPKSYIDFYISMDLLNWPKFIKIFGEDELNLPFVNIKKIDPLVFFDKTSFKIAVEESETIMNFMIESENYNYERNQFYEFSEKVLGCSYVVAYFKDSINYCGILINPLVSTKDGEWETVYFDVYRQFALGFPCFADMMSWLYQSSMKIHNDLDEFPWLDHSFDYTGVSQKLFTK